MHIPVLQKEVIKYLDPKPNENFIDCTIGEGGHTLAILEKNKPNGKVLGIEIDPQLYENLKASEIKNRLILVNDSFVNLKKIVEKYKFKSVNGILFDLGLSSWHLEKSGRGFSFQKNEPLDMRYYVMHFRRSSNLYDKLTAEKILNEWPEKEIEKILKEYGQERFAKKISKKIIEERKAKPIKTTFQLVEIIKKATPIWSHHKRMHFATRTFQALRIAVNDELENLKKVLPRALEILERNGRLVVISFHSLEDRVVKNFLKENSKKYFLKILTKKPIIPSLEEIKRNPRSRSAKLRAAIKI
jgi:16S rRNA (cytosine1402-N4)-methyltransferase